MTTPYREQRVHAAQSGFTLIEIMIAIAIIGIFLGIAVPMAMNQMRRANIKAANQQMVNIRFGIQQYQMDTGQLPARLRDLVKRPTGDERVAAKWTGPYIPGKEEPKDPWYNRFQYRVTEGGKHPYELFSYGPDGKGAPKSEHLSVWALD